jgi:hypothetical protein
MLKLLEFLEHSETVIDCAIRHKLVLFEDDSPRFSDAYSAEQPTGFRLAFRRHKHPVNLTPDR